MTRLTTHDIHQLDSELTHYNSALRKKTGADLPTLACFAAGISRESFEKASLNASVAVVPITSGQGIIGGFADSVQSIITFLGFNSFVTEGTDVAGIAEAVESKAQLIFMADDDKFIAFNVGKGLCIDNGEATGRGYVAALAHMAKGLRGLDVFVLGAGPVGQSAIACLKELGARVKLFDIKPEKLTPYHNDSLVSIEYSLPEALPKYKCLIDATPSGSFIEPDKLHPHVLIAAPGIPLGLSDEALAMHEQRLIHDPLQLGVAVMLAMAL